MSQTPQTIDVMVLDVNETLTDMSPVADLLARAPHGSVDFRAWFASLLRDGFALATTDGFASFGEIMKDRLVAALLRNGCSQEEISTTIDTVVRGLAALDAHPDVAPGLRQLHDAGYELVPLTNGSAAMSTDMFERAGVAEILARRLSVDDVGHWKPHPEAYAYAERVCGRSSEQMALIASHPWDIHGAVSAGWSGIWLNREGTPYPSYFEQPHVVVTDLRDLPAILGPAAR
jgi:2-haloacid dehalogenase